MDSDFVAKSKRTDELIQKLSKRLDALEEGGSKDSGSSKDQAKLIKERDEAYEKIKKLEEENSRLKAQLAGQNKQTTLVTTSNHKFSQRVPLKDILITNPTAFFDKVVSVAGWVRSIREGGGGRFAFVELNDGSCQGKIQIIIDADKPGYKDIMSPQCSMGASLLVVGKVVKSPGKKQLVEMQAEKVELLGACVAEKFPIGKAELTLDYLRTFPHLRVRTQTISSVARIRNSLAFAVHKFFQELGYFYIHTPIITTSDCEGAGEMFQVSTLFPKSGLAKDLPIVKENGQIDYSQDFFKKPAYLTVSGQLNGEMYACGLSKIYTFGPTFRAEISHTTRHMSEFWMIEPEVAFAELPDIMDLAEAFLKYTLRYVLDNNRDDLDFLDSQIEKGLVERLQKIANSPFKRISYTEAIDILQKAIKGGKKFENAVEWGIDLAKEHETFITDEIYKMPTMVYNYPKDIKSFYMRLNPDGKTVAAVDVLVPKIGEIIGGSQREERVELLEKRLDELKLNKAAYEGYLDLRRYGTVTHSGFGLGFERLVMYATGIQHIRDSIPFPRTPGHAEY